MTWCRRSSPCGPRCTPASPPHCTSPCGTSPKSSRSSRSFQPINEECQERQRSFGRRSFSSRPSKADELAASRLAPARRSLVSSLARSHTRSGDAFPTYHGSNRGTDPGKPTLAPTAALIKFQAQLRPRPTGSHRGINPIPTAAPSVAPTAAPTLAPTLATYPPAPIGDASVK